MQISVVSVSILLFFEPLGPIYWIILSAALIRCIYLAIRLRRILPRW